MKFKGQGQINICGFEYKKNIADSRRGGGGPSTPPPQKKKTPVSAPGSGRNDSDLCGGGQRRGSGTRTIKGQDVSRKKGQIGTHVFQETGHTDTHQNRYLRGMME